MRTSTLSTDSIEARNITADCATINARIEAYRVRQPAEHPRLIVTPPAGAANSSSAGVIPETSAQDLSIDVLRSAMAEHGGLIVRNLMPLEVMAPLMKATDLVLDACADPKRKEPPPASHYFNPPRNLSTIMPKRERELINTRTFHQESGSAMCIEAPSVAEALLDLYEEQGVKQLVTQYLGEPPCLSVKKWVLRRSRLPVAQQGWHQDGAFMGTGINSINMWMPLNRCGGDTGAPGMDIVPHRLYGVASADGAQFEWSVSDSHVSDSFDGERWVAPVFEAGDVFFFDHFYLHRTQFRTDFDKVRYAIETWFFGESAFPKNQIPLAW